jgi:hypothetical protein
MHNETFKLKISTLAIGEVNGKRVAVTIPAGDIVKVVADPSVGSDVAAQLRGCANMVDVFWAGRTVVMYAVDLKERGIKI